MNKNESRYFNTALKMNDALVFLLEKKEFNYITIKDICDISKVNRSTFYLHYSNTNDLLEEVVSNLTISFHNHLKTNENNESIVKKDNLNELFLIKDEYLIPYLEFIKANKKIYKALKNKPHLFKAENTYNEMFKTIFSPILKRFGVEEKWHKYMMDFYMSGISSILLRWIFDDCIIEVFEIAKLIKSIIVKYD